MTFFDYVYIWFTKMTGLAILFSAALTLFYFLLIRHYVRPWAKFLYSSPDLIQVKPNRAYLAEIRAPQLAFL